uniref:Uncharacterized protein n=1 Tax=Rhizophora mucronata TaxID=61149 RepID=A0A2P2PPF7_RHIMU
MKKTNRHPHLLGPCSWRSCRRRNFLRRRSS